MTRKLDVIIGSSAECACHIFPVENKTAEAYAKTRNVWSVQLSNENSRKKLDDLSFRSSRVETARVWSRSNWDLSVESCRAPSAQEKTPVNLGGEAVLSGTSGELRRKQHGKHKKEVLFQPHTRGTVFEDLQQSTATH